MGLSGNKSLACYKDKLRSRTSKLSAKKGNKAIIKIIADNNQRATKSKLRFKKNRSVINLDNKSKVITIMLIGVIGIMMLSSVTLVNSVNGSNDQVQDSIGVPQFDNNQVNNNQVNNNDQSNNDQNNDQNNNQVSDNHNYKSTSSKTKYAKLIIKFSDLGRFKGDVKIKLTNLNTDKVILKTTAKKVSVKHNEKSYKIKIGNNRIGDQLDLDTSAKTLQSGTGFWGFSFEFEKTMNVRATLDEIDCGGDCD